MTFYFKRRAMSVAEYSVGKSLAHTYSYGTFCWRTAGIRKLNSKQNKLWRRIFANVKNGRGKNGNPPVEEQLVLLGISAYVK